jgi:hypothetical protein
MGEGTAVICAGVHTSWLELSLAPGLAWMSAASHLCPLRETATENGEAYCKL